MMEHASTSADLDGEEELFGMKKWSKRYAAAIVDPAVLQSQVDEFMAEFDRRQEEEKEVAKQRAGVPDEDGWITVTSGGKRKVAQRSEEANERAKERKEKKQKKEELVSFYKFQVQESKIQRLEELRRKFEEDKKRIALMRATRKFRPV